MSANPSSNYHEIEAELRKRIEGDIRFDHYSRLLYSTDASIYQIEPIGVVVPSAQGRRTGGDRNREPVRRTAPSPWRRHVAGGTDGGTCHRLGFFQVHAERA